LSKLLNQEDAWALPVYVVISALRSARPREAQECCGKAYSFIFYVTLWFATPGPSC
jgi:hypothetical protein